MSDYTPPFSVSAKAIRLVAEISALVERCAIRMEKADGAMLRKANRIKTIRSSLAIEGNELSEDDVRTLLDGKSVIAPRQIEKHLSDMKQKGIIQRVGARRNGIWQILSAE